MRKVIFFTIATLAACIYLTGNMVQAIPYLPDAPPLPKLNKVYLKANITRDAKGIFAYSYEIINGKGSIGDLADFQIDISQPEGGLQLPDGGIVNTVKSVIEKAEAPNAGLLNATEVRSLSYGALTSEHTKPMVPVTFVSEPPDWLAGLTVTGTASWGGTRLSPGMSVSGFVLQSGGIPTIREFSAYPIFDTELLKYYPETDALSEEEDRIVEEQLAKDRETLTYKGKTLGPTSPPKELKPVEFLNNIISMKHEAFKLGWITSDAIELSLDQKLDAALKQLQSGNNAAASNILKAFIQEVEAQGCDSYEAKCPPGKHLKPEAYALLKYNVQYLVDNLK